MMQGLRLLFLEAHLIIASSLVPRMLSGSNTLTRSHCALSAVKLSAFDMAMNQAKEALGDVADKELVFRVAFAIQNVANHKDTSTRSHCALSAVKSSAFDTAMNLAKETLGDVADEELVFRVAFAIQNVANHKDNEKENIKAYFKERLSGVVQRVVLEAFLSDIYGAYKIGNGPIYDAINKSTTYCMKIKNEAQKEFPAKKILDSAIRDDQSLREAVWDRYNLDKAMSYPFLPDELLYGALSFCDYRAVLVSDEASSDYRAFFKALAEYQNKPFELYSAAAAFMGKKLDE